MLPSAHDIVTAVLVYLAIGAMIWVVLHGSCAVETVAAQWQARGRQLSNAAFLIAVVMVIVLWPLVLLRVIVRVQR